MCGTVMWGFSPHHSHIKMLLCAAQLCGGFHHTTATLKQLCVAQLCVGFHHTKVVLKRYVLPGYVKTIFRQHKPLASQNTYPEMEIFSEDSVWLSI